MGKLGNCCCTCYVPDNYELPTITKTGWTASNWTGTCCKCMTLTPNDPLPWNTCCSAEFLNQELIQSFTTYVYERRELKPLHFDGALFPAVDWEIYHFCTGSPELAYTWQNERIVERSFKLLSGLKYDRIEVCISKQDITCGEASPVEKWVVISRFYFNYISFLTWGLDSSSSKILTIESACYSGGEGASCTQSRSLNCDFQSVYDLVFDGINGNVDASLIKSGFGYFTRVKFYDTLPTGTVTFSNADVPGDCVWESCGSEDQYDDDFCINVTSIPGNIGCSCNSSSVAGPDEVYSDSIASWTCDGCDGTIWGPEQFGNFTLVTYCYDDAFSLLCQPCPDPPFECDPNSYTFEIPGNATSPPTESCADPLYDESWMSFGCQFGGGSEPQYSTDTSSDCYWQTPCFDVKKYEIFDVYTGDQQWELNCTFNPVSCCFNAPSWSVNFG